VLESLGRLLFDNWINITTEWTIIAKPSLPDNFKPTVIGLSLSVRK